MAKKGFPLNKKVMSLIILILSLLIAVFAANAKSRFFNLNGNAAIAPCSIYSDRSSCKQVKGCSWQTHNCENLGIYMCQVLANKGCSVQNCQDGIDCKNGTGNDHCQYNKGACTGDSGCEDNDYYNCKNTKKQKCTWQGSTCLGSWCTGGEVKLCAGVPLKSVSPPSETVNTLTPNSDPNPTQSLSTPKPATPTVNTTCKGKCRSKRDCSQRDRMNGKCYAGKVCCGS